MTGLSSTLKVLVGVVVVLVVISFGAFATIHAIHSQSTITQVTTGNNTGFTSSAAVRTSSISVGDYTTTSSETSTPSSTLSISSASLTSSATSWALQSTQQRISSSSSFSSYFSFTSYYSTSFSSTTSSATTLPIQHVIIIVMENAEFGDIYNSSNAPYETKLANQYALASQYYAVSHPSLPNYLALIGGSTFGITDDEDPSTPGLPYTNVVSLLESHHVSWKAYMESMPGNCALSDSDPYVVHHDPFVYFQDVQQTSWCDNVVPLSQFTSDLNSDQLPRYSFITPNTNNDGHDTSPSYGDHWLSTFVPGIVDSKEFASTAIFIVYDEGTTNLNGGGHV